MVAGSSGAGLAVGEREALTKEAVDRIDRDGVRLVDLQFTDLAGGARSMTVPADLLPDILRHGYRFDGSAVTGGQREVEIDLFLLPDPATLTLFERSGSDERRVQFACSVVRRDGHPFAGDPRSALERALARAREAGFDYRVAVEMEYYLFRGEVVGQAQDGAGYFGIGQGDVAGTRDEIVETLQRMGIGVGGAHHETGPGQEELDLLPGSALRLADHVLTVRRVIRSVAARRGLRANFMPKPLTDAPGSGMHVFQRLARAQDGSDALRGDGDDLSETALQAIAGQLAHAAGMALVLSPSVNSYKRLLAGHRAPRRATWARVSQASLIRVPGLPPARDSTVELELRSPDNLANPYLALTVALACALSGVRSGEEPPPPLDENLFRHDDAELDRLRVPRLPETLDDALLAFAEDQTVQEALGEYVCDQLLTVKRAEWDEYRRQVSPWEHARYGA